jgi:hypothetical protein
MEAITKPLQNRKQKPFFTPRDLTRQEIEELRRDKQIAHEANMKFFKDQGMK